MIKFLLPIIFTVFAQNIPAPIGEITGGKIYPDEESGVFINISDKISLNDAANNLKENLFVMKNRVYLPLLEVGPKKLNWDDDLFIRLGTEYLKVSSINSPDPQGNLLPFDYLTRRFKNTDRIKFAGLDTPGNAFAFNGRSYIENEDAGINPYEIFITEPKKDPFISKKDEKSLEQKLSRDDFQVQEIINKVNPLATKLVDVVLGKPKLLSPTKTTIFSASRSDLGASEVVKNEEGDLAVMVKILQDQFSESVQRSFSDINLFTNGRNLFVTAKDSDKKNFAILLTSKGLNWLSANPEKSDSLVFQLALEVNAAAQLIPLKPIELMARGEILKDKPIKKINKIIVEKVACLDFSQPSTPAFKIYSHIFSIKLNSLNKDINC